MKTKYKAIFLHCVFDTHTIKDTSGFIMWESFKSAPFVLQIHSLDVSEKSERLTVLDRLVITKVINIHCLSNID